MGKVYLIDFNPVSPLYPHLNDPACRAPNPVCADLDPRPCCAPDVVSLSLVGVPGPGGVPGVVLEGAAMGDQAGFAVAGGTRLNPGGAPDILIGSPGVDVTRSSTAVDAGTVYAVFDPLLLCTPSAPAASCGGGASARCVICLDRVANGQSNEIGGIVYRGERAGDRLGVSVALPGDVMGTIGDDLVMGAPGTDTDLDGDGTPDRVDAGAVYIAQGGNLGRGIIEVDRVGRSTSAIQGTALLGTQAGEQLGGAVSQGGDSMADGDRDLLMGAPFYDVDPDGTGGLPPRLDAGRVIQTASRPWDAGSLRWTASDPWARTVSTV